MVSVPKVLLWDEDYAKAAEYARKAINAVGCHTYAQWEMVDPNSGIYYS